MMCVCGGTWWWWWGGGGVKEESEGEGRMRSGRIWVRQKVAKELRERNCENQNKPDHERTFTVPCERKTSFNRFTSSLS